MIVLVQMNCCIEPTSCLKTIKVTNKNISNYIVYEDDYQ